MINKILDDESQPTTTTNSDELESLPELSSLEEEARRQLKQQNETLQNELLLALADIQNLRKRFEREKEDAQRFAVSRFSKDLLSVADNFERSLQTLPVNQSPEWKHFVVGIEMVVTGLQKVFGDYGVTKLESHGLPFDPNTHQAVSEEETNDVVPGSIVRVLQDAYMIHGRLLRPAMVIVAKAKI